MKKIKTKRSDLYRQIRELKSQSGVRHYEAYADLYKASVDKMMASGVILELTAVGGKTLINPVLIRDGLSNKTIVCLREDIQRSLKIEALLSDIKEDSSPKN